MRVHLEVEVAPRWLPFDPRAGGAFVGGTERLAVRLAEGLAARGHAVTWRGGGVRGEWAGVRALEPAEPVVCDVAVAVNTDLPASVDASRAVASSTFAQWPNHGGWDAVVALSAPHARLLGARLGADLPIAVIPGAADLAPPSDGPRDCFVYASSPDRGLHRLLDVWPDLWEAFGLPLRIAYDVRASIAALRRMGGDLDARANLLDRLNQPGIVVCGRLDAAAMDRLRARAAAYLYPLDPVEPWSELFSLSLLEAAGAGVPLVVSPVDALGEVYAGVARFVEPGGPAYDPDAWIAAVGEVLAAPEPWASAGRAFAARHTWTARLDAWEDVLRSAEPRRAERADWASPWLVIGDGPVSPRLSAVLGALAARGAAVAWDRPLEDTRVYPIYTGDDLQRLLCSPRERLVLLSPERLLARWPSLRSEALEVPTLGLDAAPLARPERVESRIDRLIPLEEAAADLDGLLAAVRALSLKRPPAPAWSPPRLVP